MQLDKIKTTKTTFCFNDLVNIFGTNNFYEIQRKVKTLKTENIGDKFICRMEELSKVVDDIADIVEIYFMLKKPYKKDIAKLQWKNILDYNNDDLEMFYKTSMRTILNDWGYQDIVGDYFCIPLCEMVFLAVMFQTTELSEIIVNLGILNSFGINEIENFLSTILQEQRFLKDIEDKRKNLKNNNFLKSVENTFLIDKGGIINIKELENTASDIYKMRQVLDFFTKTKTENMAWLKKYFKTCEEDDFFTNIERIQQDLFNLTIDCHITYWDNLQEKYSDFLEYQKREKSKEEQKMILKNKGINVDIEDDEEIDFEYIENMKIPTGYVDFLDKVEEDNHKTGGDYYIETTTFLTTSSLYCEEEDDYAERENRA